uniref:limulus clotting factor C n=2 Tax=Hirondellea gigas TaxID=1518452 RepID=A0A2P2HXU6_9CRUS
MGLSTFISAVPSVSPIEPLVSYEEQPSIGSSAPLLPPVEVVTLPPYVSSTEPVTTHEPTTIPPPWTTTPTSWPWLSPDSSVEVCGKARFGPENRSSRRGLKILEGKEALPGSFPWQVAILDDDRDLHCGGTLIAPRWVVTAAHCIKKKLFVRLFEHHMMEKDGFEVEQKVRRIYRHPDFNTSTIDNDIALLRLPALPAFPEESTGVVSRGVTSRACLPANAEDFPPVGTRCMVMGWGKASMVHNYGTDVLMYTRLPIISRKACIKANRKVITENMFCAGHYKGGSDTCSGDSGGPLLCSVSGAPGEETWTMYGVTSFGDGCGNVGKMGVYAKVNNYLQWMSDIMSRYY